ncbi:peptide ABC transporter permease [Actinoplanes sp. SE50]|uniref:ABC transporter permease n=1 Tax=unclassified Actinoplanes TaxID=2626549 RepID=UPI00023EC5C5|nr:MULTISPECIES: ABC transporter permease [unclassified Actinoplanes]AEV83086.1 Oligopeptide transport system permease protein appC [Actinoplanes sp. SE50/110]ATO81482.1 peptide ABC transporter permease [Actinoplanes sp. SE50]SLL98889.1 ABC-type peptide/nickel transporter, permease component [Actinoplanes sp. SE50/110]
MTTDTESVVVGAPPAPRSVSRNRLVLRRFLRQRLAVVGLIVVVLMVLIAYLGPLFYKWKYDQLDFEAFQSPPTPEHWFGTYQTGGDVFSRTLRGLQKSLVIGLLGAGASTALAAVAGAFAGYFRGSTDMVIRVIIDLMLVLPSFLIIAIFSTALRDGSWLLFIVLLAGFQWMITARVVRGITQSLREREFVQAARFMGVPGWKIILRHILPNMASLLIIDATVGVSSIILAEVGLSFFGFGVQPPDVSLGTLIADGSGAALTNWWQFYFVAGVLVLLVLAVNLVGDGLRDALDPNSEIEGAK